MANPIKGNESYLIVKDDVVKTAGEFTKAVKLAKELGNTAKISVYKNHPYHCYVKTHEIIMNELVRITGD